MTDKTTRSSDASDPSELQSMMDDLRRGRQEEFALAGGTNNSSFTPNQRGNGVDHIPKGFVNQIQKGWSSFEKDEESEQMQGLRNDNARPWAESIARQIVSNNSEIVKHPNAQAQAQALPRRRQDNGSRETSRRSGNTGLQPGSWSSRRAQPHQTHDRPSALPPVSSSGQAPARQASACPLPALAKVLPRNFSSCKVRMQPPLHQSLPGTKSISHDGYCQVESGDAEPFIAEFCIVFPAKGPGQLVLTAPGKDSRAHKLYDLTVVSDDGPCCTVEAGDIRYKFRMCNDLETQNMRTTFQRLAGVRSRPASATPNALALHRDVKQSPNDDVKTHIEKPNEGKKVHIVQDMQNNLSLRNKATEEHQMERALENAAPPSDPNDLAVKSPPVVSSAPDCPLINVDDEDAESPHIPQLGIDEVADHVLSIVGKLIPEVSTFGISVTDDVISGLEVVALDEWFRRCSGRDMIRGVDEETCEDLQVVIRHLMKMKQRAQRIKMQEASQKQLEISPNTRELHMAFAQPPATERITYSAQDLVDLKLVNTQNLPSFKIPLECIANPGTTTSVPEKTGHPANVLVAVQDAVNSGGKGEEHVAKSKRGLAGSMWAHEEDQLPRTAKTPPLDEACGEFVRRATSASIDIEMTDAAPISAQKSGTKPAGVKLGGLKSSRWAD